MTPESQTEGLVETLSEELARLDNLTAWVNANFAPSTMRTNVIDAFAARRAQIITDTQAVLQALWP